jgi:hypothetical protein
MPAEVTTAEMLPTEEGVTSAELLENVFERVLKQRETNINELKPRTMDTKMKTIKRIMTLVNR